MKTTRNYTIFALLATTANIGSQDIFLRVYNNDYSITASILVGTVIGLLVKYILDKKYIFKFQIENIAHDTQTFTLYSLMGVVTTIIFWGFEFSFDYLFNSKEMRYTGGIIGLAIGYYIKYQLDKRFVFVHRGLNGINRLG